MSSQHERHNKRRSIARNARFMFYNNLWWIYQKVAGQYIISVSSVLAMVPMASVLGDVVHVGHSESDAIYQSNAHPRDLFILLLIIRPEFRKDML